MGPNDTVRVTLNEVGLRIFKDYFCITKDDLLYKNVIYTGYWETQLWQVIETLGSGLNPRNETTFISIEKV